MTDRRGWMLPTVAVVVALAIPAGAFAAAGDPDATFNGTGQLTTGFGTTPFHAGDSGNAAARDGSGRIYIAGTTPANNGDIALVRLTAAGTLDTTFGTNGIATADIGGASDRGTGVAIDGSGNIWVAGTTGDQSAGDDFALVRFTSSGVLDATFGGGDGEVTTDFAGGAEVAAGLALVGSGAVVVGQTDLDPDEDHDSGDFAVAKYTSAGVLDSTFGGSTGKVTTDFGSDGDQAFAVLATGSTFVVAGRTDPSGADSGDFALARYTASTGALDVTFGTGGKQTVDFSGVSPNGDFGLALAVDSSNRIIVAGNTGNADCGVARLSGTDGTPDNTFDTDGKQTVSTPASGSTLSSSDQCWAVAVQADNSVVLGGVEYSNGGKWILARLSSAGTVDSGFGSSGIVVTDYSSDPSVIDLAAAVFVDEANSKIIAAGSGNSNFAAARYAKADGTIDTTFGPNSSGKVEVDVVSAVQSSESATGVVVQPDGKLVVVGPTNAGPTTQTKGDLEFGLARYNANGSLDTGFGSGGNGLVTTNFGTNGDGTGTKDTPVGVALQSDGKIVVAGTTDPPGADKGDFALARFLANGTPDPSFGGGDGLVTTNIGGVNGDAANGVAVEGTPGSPGFRIVVAGTESIAGQSQVIAVAAYDEDGDPDPGFNGGQQTTDLDSVAPTAGVAIQPDGKVLIAATDGDFFPAPVDWALVRYTTTGAPDSSFGGGDGIVTTDFAGGYDQAYSVAVQDLGSGQVRIVVGGRAAPTSGTTGDGGIAAYTTDGSLDPSFAPGGADGDGKLTFDMGSASGFDGVRGIAFQPDGKIGGAGSVGAGDFGALRVTSAGSLDTSFGGDGLASSSFPNPNLLTYTAAGVALQADGKIVAAGGPFSPFGGSDFLVARYEGVTQPTPPSSGAPSSGGGAPTPAPPAKAKKKCKKKKHRAAAAKKCKKKK